MDEAAADAVIVTAGKAKAAAIVIAAAIAAIFVIFFIIILLYKVEICAGGVVLNTAHFDDKFILYAVAYLFIRPPPALFHCIAACDYHKQQSGHGKAPSAAACYRQID